MAQWQVKTHRYREKSAGSPYASGIPFIMHCKKGLNQSLAPPLTASMPASTTAPVTLTPVETTAPVMEMAAPAVAETTAQEETLNASKNTIKTFNAHPQLKKNFDHTAQNQKGLDELFTKSFS